MQLFCEISTRCKSISGDPVDKKKLIEIYVALWKEVDELHDDLEALKIEPGAPWHEHCRLTHPRIGRGLIDYSVSEFYSKNYLLSEIQRKLDQRAEFQQKIQMFKDPEAYLFTLEAIEEEFADL